MRKLLRAIASLALAGLLTSPGAQAADLLGRVEDAYALRGIPRVSFDARRIEGIASAEAVFLEALFALTDEAALLDANGLIWLASRGEKGLHPEVHGASAGSLGERLAELEIPPRLAAVHGYIAEARRLQAGFLADWHTALREGRPFESQLTDEVAYHAGLHRSHRMVLKAFAELRALYPSAGDAEIRAFRSHLRALDLR